MMTHSEKKISIIVPVYNGADHIETTLRSLTSQTYTNIEIIVSDDASPDNARQIAERMQSTDDRIIIIGDGINRGTLLARKLGVEASSGDYVMFIDQDDELVPNAISDLMKYTSKQSADIYHLSVEVIPVNDAARSAAAGMQSFLTPPARYLKGSDILVYQLRQENGFDWHLHHKLYEGTLARKAYNAAADERLVLSDDFYLCFIMAALAKNYLAIPDLRVYRYYLGRGDTFGAEQTSSNVASISSRNARAYQLIEEFVHSDKAPKRNDWDERLNDAKRCLVDYPINEWKDGLDCRGQSEALQHLLSDWPPEYIIAELWRFTRDSTYALWTHIIEDDENADILSGLREEACYYRDLALSNERECNTASCAYQRYTEMKAAAVGHLRDTGLLPAGYIFAQHPIKTNAPNRITGKLETLLAKLKRRA